MSSPSFYSLQLTVPPPSQDARDPFCSPRCREIHAQNERSLAPASSVPSSPLSVTSDLSILDLNHPLPPSLCERELHAEDWVGKGSEGVRVWAAAVPLGAPPLSSSPTSASSPLSTFPHHLRSRSSTSSLRSPSAAAGASSVHSSPAKVLAHSSSTLRPSLASLSSRTPAPPRLFLASSSPSHQCAVHSHGEKTSDASPCSPYTATCTALPHASTSSLVSPVLPKSSPTQPILNPRVSLPSLTTQSATASLSSLATPHTASRPPSRPQSRPSSFYPHANAVASSSRPHSRSVSVAGSDMLDLVSKPLPQTDHSLCDLDEDPFAFDGEDEANDDHTPEGKPRRTSFFHATVHRISTGVRQWAAGERMVGHIPYSSAHVVPPQLRERNLARAPVTRQSQRLASELESMEHLAPTPTRASSPRPMYRSTEPIVRDQGRVRGQSPEVMYVQDGFTRAFLERKASAEGEFGLEEGKKETGMRLRGGKQYAGRVEREKEKEREHGKMARMGRGLVPQRVASRMDIAAHFAAAQQPQRMAISRPTPLSRITPGSKPTPIARSSGGEHIVPRGEREEGDVDAEDDMFDHPAWRTRGRRAQRAERRFLAQQAQTVAAQ